MNRSLDRRSLVVGVLLGVGAFGLLFVGMGAGAAMSSGEPIVTWGGDGKQVYLWRIAGDHLEFVSEARADKGRGDDANDHGANPKGKDKDSDDDADGDDGDATKGKDKSKDKGKSKGKDKGNG